MTIIPSLLDGNWDVILCYDKVFDWTLLSRNVGSWMIIIITLLYIANMIYYYVTTINPIKEQLFRLFKSDEKETQSKGNVNNNEQKAEEIIRNTDIDNNRLNPIRINNMILRRKKSNNSSNQILNQSYLVKTQNKLLFQLNNKQTKQQSLTAEDYKDMEFPSLFLDDYRSFFKDYWCYLQLTHPILNTFYTMSKRELRSIKIASFIKSFVISFTLSAFFYSDDYISHNNKNNGNVDLWYNLPISIYTFLIGGILGIVLKLLSYSEEGIRKTEEMQHKQTITKQEFYCFFLLFNLYYWFCFGITQLRFVVYIKIVNGIGLLAES